MYASFQTALRFASRKATASALTPILKASQGSSSIASYSSSSSWVMAERSPLYRADLVRDVRSLCTQSNNTTDKAQKTNPTPPKTTPEVADAKRSPITWKTVGMAMASGTAILAYYNYENQKRMEKLRESVPKTEKAGAPRVGGEFDLISCKTGQVFTQENLKGDHYSLLYFGFTFCPDVCPDEMDKITEVVNAIDADDTFKTKVVPIFISIDPERDTPQKVKEYLEDFHPSFIGLTGSIDQCAKAAKAYRVYYSRDRARATDYLVDHSIITYLIDSNGTFREFYGRNVDAKEIVERIRKQM